MFLSKLRIRGKLGALVLLPLIVIAALAITLVAGQISSARAAGRTLASVDLASRIGTVVADLQAERLDSIGFLTGAAKPTDVQTTRANLDEEISDLRTAYGDSLSGSVAKALDGISGLDNLRIRIDARTASTPEVIAGFAPVISALLDATHVTDGVDTSTEAGREILALDSLTHINELTNESAAILIEIAGVNDAPITSASSAAAVAAYNAHQQALLQYNSNQLAITSLLPRFTADATPDDVALHDIASQALVDRLGPSFVSSFKQDPAATARALTAPVVYPQMQSYITLGRFAEQKITADVVTAVSAQRDDTLIEAYVTGAIALVVVVGVAALGAVIARSVANPLADLTASTHRVAVLAEAELQRVADDEAESEEPIHFDPVRIATEDEIGDLARAFERISSTSVRLVGRQVVSRRNVAQMFGHVGRRTQNLVGRQIALIDALEAQETDARRLEDLYRLDHLTSRLRRNASSLVALSGASDSGGHFAPLPIVDVVRLALGEIEEYTRIDLEPMPNLEIMPSAINDTVLLLAELLENATNFSPPHTRVSVAATALPPRLTITDHGIGLPPDRLAAENARLASRERLDLAPTEVLGLFVVGRLARRHGLGVVMTETPGGGVTVAVDLRGAMVQAALAASPLAAAPPPITPPPLAYGNGRPASPLIPEQRGPHSTTPAPGWPPPAWSPSGAPPPVPQYPGSQYPGSQYPGSQWPSPPDPGQPYPQQQNPQQQWPEQWQSPPQQWPEPRRPPQQWPQQQEPAQQWPEPQWPAQQPPEQQWPAQQPPEQQWPAQQPPEQQWPEQQWPGQQWPEQPEPPGLQRERPALPAPIDVAKIDRANRAIEEGRPWRAFELPTPALAATPYDPAADGERGNGGSLYGQPRHPDDPGRRVDRDVHTLVLPAVSEGSPLTRRVPGATMRVDPVAQSRQNVAPQDPDDVWNLVNQFESGVARALDEVRSEPTEEDPR